MKLKLKFWDNERKIMLESPVAVSTAFRNYSEVANSTSFPSCDNQPDPRKYEPLIFVGNDSEGEELYTSDIVMVRLEIITPDPVQPHIFGEICYDERECCFCVKIIENGESEMLPLFGIMPAIKKKGNKYEHKKN